MSPASHAGQRTGSPIAKGGFPVTITIVLLWLVLSGISLLAFSRDQAKAGTWGCEMSYMYQSYQRLEWDQAAFARYAVYLYRDPHLDTKTATGSPVLFVPGNAGSFQQVRSIASSAAHQHYSNTGQENSVPRKPLDFFTVDFNEEFSAFHAPTLQEQARFVATAIPHILASYDHLPPGQRPHRIILVGHSMGGIVARLASTSMPNGIIDAIVTMSTPHWVPPVGFESAMDGIYKTIDATAYVEPRPLLISICGGVSDTEIISDTCALSEDVVGPSDGFAIYTTGMPGVWTGVDHQAMVWCHQVRWRVARSLLDMSAAGTRSQQLQVARHWLVGDSTPRSSPLSSGRSSSIAVDVNAESMSMLIHAPHATEAMIASPPITPKICHLGRCTAWQQSSIRTIPRPDNGRPFPLPGEGVKPHQATFVLDLRDLPQDGAMIQVEVPEGSQVASGVHLAVNVAGSTWKRIPASTPLPHLTLHFRSALVSSLMARRLTMRTGSCLGSPPIIEHCSLPASSQYRPSMESRFYPVTNGSVTIHSHISGAPFQGHHQQSRGIRIDVYQQPECLLEELTISIDMLATLAKAAHRLRIAIIVWCTGWVATVFAVQLGSFQKTAVFPSFNTIIEQQYLRLLGSAISILAGAHVVLAMTERVGLGASHVILGFGHPLLIPVSSLALLWSFGAVVTVRQLLDVGLAVTGRVLGRQLSGRDAEPHWTAMWSRIIPAGLLLVVVRLSIPYRMAFIVLFLFLFVIVATSQTGSARYHLTSACVLLMAFQVPFNATSIAVWGRNVWSNRGHPFQGDHALLPLIPALLVVVLSSLDTDMAENQSLARLSLAAAVGLAATALVLGPRRPYVVPFACNVLFVVAAGLLGGRKLWKRAT